MSYLPINTGDIQEDMNQYVSMLRRHKEIKADLKLRLDELADMHETHEAHIRRVSLASVPYDRDHIQTSKDVGDLLNVVLQVEDSEKDEALEHLATLESIEIEDESINRVWDAYRATSPENHILLYELYVQNTKWEALVEKYGSRSNLGNRRQAAVKEALSLYNNLALDSLELHRMANHRSSLFVGQTPKKNKKKKSDSPPGQLSMDDFMFQTE